MALIRLRDGVSFESPTVRALATLFEEAELEFEAGIGRGPETGPEWTQIVRAYQDKVLRTPAAAGLVERIVPAVVRPRPLVISSKAIDLSERMTAFGRAVASALSPAATDGIRTRVVSPFEAVEALRWIAQRYGLEDAVVQGDQSRHPTIGEAPELFIANWHGTESAIVLDEDREGPRAMAILTRLSLDSVKVVKQVGPASTDTLRQALAALGLTEARD